MNKEALKDKTLVTLDKNINIYHLHNRAEDLLFSKVMIYQYDDIKSAIELLKKLIKDYPKYSKGYFDKQICSLKDARKEWESSDMFVKIIEAVDKAFPDLLTFAPQKEHNSSYVQ